MGGDFGEENGEDEDDEDDEALLYCAVVLSLFRAFGESILGTQRCLYIALSYFRFFASPARRFEVHNDTLCVAL